MNWITLAIVATFFMGTVNVLDSHLVSKRMPGMQIYLFLVSSVLLISAIIFCILFPLPPDIPLTTWLLIMGQCITRISAVIFTLYLYQREEVSRVIPVVYSYPIFVAFMAIPLLGETMNSIQWLAILMVVIGAIIISVRRSLTGKLTMLIKLFLMLLGIGILYALTDLSGKYVLSYISFYNLYWINIFFMCLVCYTISLRPQTIRQFQEIKQKKVTLTILAVTETLAVFGSAMGLWALQLGPVALVSTITASRPIFVLLTAFVLSRTVPSFLDFNPGKGMIIPRFIATAMIIGGISLIYLN